jgi:hypothetical protein
MFFKVNIFPKFETKIVHFSKRENARPLGQFSTEFVYTRDSLPSDQNWECVPRKCSKILAIATDRSAMSADWCVYDRQLPMNLGEFYQDSRKF